MNILKKKFGFEEQLKTPLPLLGEDFVFKVEEYSSLKGFEHVHQEVSLVEQPLGLERTVFLSHVEEKQTTLQLHIILCWNGYKDALELLYKFPESFQRAVPVESVSETAKEYQIGSTGFGWSWEGSKKPEMLSFVRNNVFISVQGSCGSGDVILSFAKEIDDRLAKQKTQDEYPEAKEGLFSREKREETLAVSPGGRIDIGTFPPGEKSVFFLTTAGSVNRDADNPDLWYYRAGMEKGKQEVTLFWVEAGVLPRKERLIIEVG
jgi:hypothetical protein